jgi:hypothetical protein
MTATGQYIPSQLVVCFRRKLMPFQNYDRTFRSI